MKKIITALAAAFMMVFTAVTAYAEIPDLYYNDRTIPDERLKPRLVDDADILSDSEEVKLLEKLDSISEAHQIDVAVVTINSLGDRTPQEYADDYYDYNGFGFGSERDGFVMLLAMDSRDRWFSGCGNGISIYTDYGQEYMWDQVTPMLSDGDYYEAFATYADLSDKFITEWEKGTPYDTNHKVKGKLHFGWYIAAVVGGLLIGLIHAEMVKAELTSVSMQHGAEDYVRPNSFALSVKRDTFMYKNVSREYIERSSSSGGGGTSTHSSSSGSSHSGSGGKF